MERHGEYSHGIFVGQELGFVADNRPDQFTTNRIVTAWLLERDVEQFPCLAVPKGERHAKRISKRDGQLGELCLQRGIADRRESVVLGDSSHGECRSRNDPTQCGEAS